MHRASCRRPSRRALVALALGMLTLATSPVVSDAQEPAASPAAGLLVELVWETRGGPEPFAGPYDPVVAPDGTVYVTDGANDNVRVFDAAGNPLRTIGERGSGDGQFRFDGISIYAAVDRDGNLYVADVNNQRVQKFDREGRFLLAFGSFGTGDGQFVRPWAVAVAADGNVLVADGEVLEQTQWFDPQGTFLGRWVANVAADTRAGVPGQMSVDSQGHIWTVAWGPDDPNVLRGVQEFDAGGRLLRTLGSLEPGDGQIVDPIDVAVDAQGYIYVSRYSVPRVQVFDPAGNYVAQWNGSEFGIDPFREVSGLDVSDDGHLYVVDLVTKRLLKFRLLPPLGLEATLTA